MVRRAVYEFVPYFARGVYIWIFLGIIGGRMGELYLEVLCGFGFAMCLLNYSS